MDKKSKCQIDVPNLKWKEDHYLIKGYKLVYLH